MADKLSAADAEAIRQLKERMDRVWRGRTNDDTLTRAQIQEMSAIVEELSRITSKYGGKLPDA